MAIKVVGNGPDDIRVEVDDADYECDGTETLVALTAITIARTTTMAPSADVSIGKRVCYKDECGDVTTPQRPWSVTCYGTDTVDSYSGMVFQSPHICVTVRYGGNGKWFEESTNI